MGKYRAGSKKQELNSTAAIAEKPLRGNRPDAWPLSGEARLSADGWGRGSESAAPTPDSLRGSLKAACGHLRGGIR